MCLMQDCVKVESLPPPHRFKAPSAECQQRPDICTWVSDEDTLYIKWGTSGLHQVQAARMEAVKGNTLQGIRHQDGEDCSATFISKDQAQLDKEENDDLYNVLALDEDADEKAIKKAYRKLSIKYHPDKNPGDETATKKFNAVRDANEILSNPDLKILYDTGGMEAVDEHKKEEQQGGGGGHPFFGGGGQDSKKGQDYTTEIEVTLEDMYNGGVHHTSINRRVVCRGCAKKPNQAKCQGCGRCPNEVKMVQRQMGHMLVNQQQEVASKEKCKNQEKTLEALIEKGMNDGSEIKFPRMSEQKPKQIPGDVVLKVKQKKHSKYRRSGKDLHITLDITLKEALLGFRKEIQHLDSHTVIVKRTGVSRPFEIMEISEEGMPVHNFPSDFGSM